MVGTAEATPVAKATEAITAVRASRRAMLLKNPVHVLSSMCSGSNFTSFVVRAAGFIARAAFFGSPLRHRSSCGRNTSPLAVSPPCRFRPSHRRCGRPAANTRSLRRPHQAPLDVVDLQTDRAGAGQFEEIVVRGLKGLGALPSRRVTAGRPWRRRRPRCRSPGYSGPMN